MKQAYTILEWISEAGYLEKNYEVYCPYEAKSTGKIYDNLLDLLGEEESTICPDCGNDINLANNSILIYKVLKEVNITYGS